MATVKGGIGSKSKAENQNGATRFQVALGFQHQDSAATPTVSPVILNSNNAAAAISLVTPADALTFTLQRVSSQTIRWGTNGTQSGGTTGLGYSDFRVGDGPLTLPVAGGDTLYLTSPTSGATAFFFFGMQGSRL